MRADDLDYLAEFLRRRAGIELVRQRPHLIEGRLAPIARRFGYRDVPALLSELRHAREVLARAVTEAMTTKDSAFFRDRAVFDHVREALLPRLVAARATTKRLRIWSAACAAGQEAYSLAMLLDEMKLSDEGWSIDVIASDLSSDQIARAEEGSYTDYEVERGVSAKRLAAYFTRRGSSFRVNDRLRRMVSFRTFNLLDSYGWLFGLDAVFCRNVLIFFDERAKIQVIEKMSEIVARDGFLVLGHAENISSLDRYFTRCGAAGCYEAGKQVSGTRYQSVAKIA